MSSTRTFIALVALCLFVTQTSTLATPLHSSKLSITSRESCSKDFMNTCGTIEVEQEHRKSQNLFYCDRSACLPVPKIKSYSVYGICKCDFFMSMDDCEHGKEPLKAVHMPYTTDDTFADQKPSVYRCDNTLGGAK